MTAAAISPDSVRRAHLAGRRALIVDDNATNRAVLHHQLERWGMRDREATGGAEALRTLLAAAAAGDPFDAALLDMQMPGMDGLELARAIRKEPALEATRLIMLTSLGAGPTATETREAGISECLLKPVRQSRLDDSLTRNLGEMEPSERRAPVAAAPVPELSPLRILLAEDNLVNQKVALALLRKLGYLADVVGDGRAAVVAQLRQPYDVILMDCQMPELEGYEATRQIRAHESSINGSLPSRAVIIALTAHALEGEREKCLAAGMDDFLTKPVSVQALGAALVRASKAIACGLVGLMVATDATGNLRFGASAGQASFTQATGHRLAFGIPIAHPK
ncbi:MAG: response regulator [Opitutaceae bacterium]|nr:response regulator [Opitutaceae bacterium]